MEYTLNPVATQETLDILVKEYIEDRSQEEHLTDYIYCLTKTWDNKHDPLPPTEQTLMLWVTGLGLERVLIEGRRAPKIEYDGILMSPDFDFSFGPGELKTTRQSSKRGLAGDYPLTWHQQFMGYLKGRLETGIMEYDGRGRATMTLTVLYLMGNYSPPFPQLLSWDLSYNREEIETNWLALSTRRGWYKKYEEQDKRPDAFHWNQDWECGEGQNKCVYWMRCAAASASSRQEQRSQNQDAGSGIPRPQGVDTPPFTLIEGGTHSTD